MSKKLWDVIIVGGGPAGVTAALRLAKENLDVLLVEAAVYPGAENWSGAVYFAERLADPKVLGAEELERAPYERRVVKRGFFSCDGFTMAGAEYRDPDAFQHCFTVLRPVFDRYLAERARQLGVTLLSATTADGLIRHGDRVIGVHTDRGPLYGELVFLAEGDASHLVSKEGFEGDRVRAKQSGQPAFLQGVKEVIELGAGVIEQRFDVGPDEAACYEVLLRNGELDGKPLRLNMAGLIYTNRSSVSIGLVLPMENLAAFRGDYNTLMEWFKALPPIQRLIEGGVATSYGAKIIRGGGLRELPALVDHGLAVGGAATGIGVDFPYPNYTGPACAMGAIFGEAAIKLFEERERPTRERLEELYVKPLQATNYYQDVEFLRDWPAFIEGSEALFGRQIDLLNGSLYTMTRPELKLGRKWSEAIRAVGLTLKGEWSSTLGDLKVGAKALGLRRFALKHAPLALLLSIPNTLLALLPFAWGRGTGELRFSFWVKDEATGKLPWFKRWLAARYHAALARAAGVLYANDGRPLRQKLDRCVGLVLRRLSLWEIAGTVLGAIGFAATRLRQRSSEAAPGELSGTAYGRWLAGARAYRDLAAAPHAASQSHDAKLGEISYEGEPGAHIKVFFPPEKPGKLADPVASNLWSACPAAVYQINVDRTQHASVAVNFENCVKCETCWRLEPQHVDWTRFGQHRLVYEVYTPADEALRRLLAERQIQPEREIEPDFWRATLRDKWGGDGVPAASAELRDALATAQQAIHVTKANAAELSEHVWNGPRVLEPGQFAWYREAVDYFADLAVEAAAAALAAPINAWLTDHGLAQADISFHQVQRDLEQLAARARDHAAAGRFFAAEADARQICDHHLEGLRACIDHVAEACDQARGYASQTADSLPPDEEAPGHALALEAFRTRIAQTFDRAALRRLEHGENLEADEAEFLKSVARAVGGGVPVPAYDELPRLSRSDILTELARVDASLAAIVASHAAAVAALARAGAHDTLLEPLRNAERFAAIALEAHAELIATGWNARLPFTLLAMADCFVARGDNRLALFHRNDRRVQIEETPAIGLTGARVGEITLDAARPEWESAWEANDETFLFGLRARDAAAIALGAGTICVERTVQHALSRIQFPDMFQDIDGRDAIGKFGAVRAYCGRIEAARLAIETLLRDAAWDDPDGIEAAVAKVAVSDIFGPDLPSLTYLAGQVIGGSAFSEEDIFSKIYRDSSVFPHYIRENAELNVEIGKRLDARSSPDLLATLSAALDANLTATARRPIFEPEIERLRRAEAALAGALHAAVDRGPSAVALQVVHDIVGEVASQLYVWARMLARANDRLEAALPGQRYVEAARLWADTVEERLVDLEPELEAASDRITLGAYAFHLNGYPDVPIATHVPDFDYEKQIIQGERGYKSGDFLLEPFDIDETRYIPELVWADETVRSHYEEYLALFRQRFVEGDYEPSFERYIEALHYIPREDIDWTLEQGFFRVIIPAEYGGQGRPKADYYSLCQVSKRLADVSHTLTIQANTSIGTTPMLLGLDEVERAERDLKAVLEQADAVAALEEGIQNILAVMGSADYEELKNAYIEVNTEVGAKLGRSRILKKVVFGKFMSQMRKAGGAGLKGDLAGFGQGLEGAVAALAGWRERAEAELDEMPRRRFAHEFYLRLISARMISAFALTEPSAGSDTARVRTEARPESRRVHTDADGIKYFFIDEAAEQGRRNIADMRRFEFDGRKIFYRYDDDALPAEVQSQEYTYSDDEEKYRYFMIGDRRVDIHDMAWVRERDGAEYYDFFVLNGAKMWITNGHIAGVEAIYARTPTGLTGFMVDALTEGFLVGKDEEKTGQRGSPTNEIGLTNVRIPKECIIGIEGRGQENALETLNVGRTGLCVSSGASIQQAIGDAARFVSRIPRGAEGWARYRLGLALEEMFAVETVAQNLIGLYDDKTSDALRMEASIAKLFGTDGLHRNLHFLEPTYGIDGQLQRHRIEKDRRDARVMTIYEGTNEIQQFLQLGDLLNSVGPKLEKIEGSEIKPGDSPFAAEAVILGEMLGELHERVNATRATYKRDAFGRVLLQPIFFRLSRMITLIKSVDSVVHRAHWIARNLTAEGDAQRQEWSEKAARGFVARAQREFGRLLYGFDRDFERLKSGAHPSELVLAETVFDEAEAAAVGTEAGARIERGAICRDLEVVVALEYTPKLAPRPRIEAGQVAEHVYGFTAGDRRALRHALALKQAAPDRVRVTLVCAAPPSAEDGLRRGLAAGADRALLLDTGGAAYAEHAVARAMAAALRDGEIAFDFLLSGATGDSPSDGRLARRLAVEFETDCVPSVTDLWVEDDSALFTSARFPNSAVRLPLPSLAAVAAPETEPEWAFTTADYTAALRKSLDVLPFDDGAERSDETFSTAAVAAGDATGDEAGGLEPERAAAILVQLGDLGDGAGAAAAEPYTGDFQTAHADLLELTGVIFIPELAGDELARTSRAPAAAAASIAARSSQPLTALVLGEPMDESQRRSLAGQLRSVASCQRIVFAEHSTLADGASRARTEALLRLMGPAAGWRPSHLVTTPWLADAFPALAGALRQAEIAAEEIPGVNRLEFHDGDAIVFVRPIHERKLRARRTRPAAGDGMRLIWCEPEVATEAAEAVDVETEVYVAPLELDYDPQADALARAIAEADLALGTVTLENAEFVIDVGAGLGSIDNLETIVDPLRQALLDLGAPHVEIGATRKVTIDMSWLPDERQIGQTGVRVNPRVMIALGVSGAPQHIDWVGDRAAIFAFNLDPQAPLMTLNQRREQPKVYPVVGDLTKTVPRFVAALKGRAEER